jgi:hypothetical protein
MNCISSPALDDIEIAKYVDGEADEAVVAHIKECLFCREKAGRWTLLQNRLKKQLYRASCPGPMELGDYHLRLLPATQMLLVAQHVRGCPLCRRDVAELEDFLAEPAPQSGLLRPTRVLIAQLISGPGLGQEHGEGRSAPAMAGLRGDEQALLIYQADGVQIVIELHDEVEQTGMKSLLGLVTGLTSKEFGVQASQEGKVIARTSADEIGNFTISHLSPGHYQLVLSSSDVEIHVHSLEVK